MVVRMLFLQDTAASDAAEAEKRIKQKALHRIYDFMSIILNNFEARRPI